MSETTYTIKKAKLRNGCLEVEYSKSIKKSEEESIYNQITESSSAQAHIDLVNAFDKLKFHLAQICDLKESTLTIDEMTGISVTGFSIGGYDEHEGVVLIGQKKLGKKVLNLITPFTKWKDEHDPYSYSTELYDDVQHCIAEVELYLEGKAAAIQTELDFKEGDSEKPIDPLPDSVTAPLKALRKSMKKSGMKILAKNSSGEMVEILK